MLFDLIKNDLKTAMKAKEVLTVSTLRMITSSIKNIEISNRTSSGEESLDEAGIIQLLSKMVKQRKESAEIYKTSNRSDLSQQENDEIVIISKFLPEQLTEEEIHNICQEIVKNTNASSIKDMGLCMGKIKNSYSSQMDFSIAGKILKELLK